MDWNLLYLLPLVVAIILVVVAFRAHERFWSLGFLGWRRVYMGLGAYTVAGILSGILYWVSISAPTSGAVPWLQSGLILFGALGVILVLAGSIERLRELSEEHAHLEDVRAGFDLFDTLREIIGQPYAFLEILDYALKEMVRAAGVDSGGLWLYNQSKSEWILTGWANLSEKLRQQTESVKGTGTGFDRLAGAHKARLFVGAEKLRGAFPEWEAEGFQSILGLPLVSGSVGSSGRQILGAILLADNSSHRFDDDRARRLYAASDYVAAVIAEARIVRQLDSARTQLDGAFAELEREREDARKQREAAEARLVELRTSTDEEVKSLELQHLALLTETRDTAATTLATTRDGLESRHQAELKVIQETAAAKLAATRTDLESRLADEIKSLKSDHQSQITNLQKRHDDELARVRQDAASARQTLETQMAQLRRQQEVELQAVRSEYETVIDDAETVHAEELRIATEETNSVREELDTRLSNTNTAHASELQAAQTAFAAELATETEHLTEARARVEAARKTIADMENRLASERHDWEARLDQIHLDAQSERKQERTRYDQLSAEHQALLQSSEKQVADLKLTLNDLERLAADRAGEIRSAQAMLKEREESLGAERQAREELARSHQSAIDILQSRLDNAKDELARHIERVESLNSDLEQANEMIASQQSSLTLERNELGGKVEALQAELAQVAQASASTKERLERELDSVNSMAAEREGQIEAMVQAQQDAIEEQRVAEEEEAGELREKDEALRAADEALSIEAERRVTLEAEVAELHGEQAELETRRQRELVEERLDHRRRLHTIEFEMATMRERLQRALALPDPRERVESLTRSIAEQMPSTRLYVWRRQPDGSAQMVGWMDEGHELFDGEDLQPWTFEEETIPAEGVTELTDTATWEQRVTNHLQPHLDSWFGHWGPDAEPTWCVCWPWRGDASGTIGWVSAFGFGGSSPTADTVDSVDAWVNLIGAALESIPVNEPIATSAHNIESANDEDADGAGEVETLLPAMSDDIDDVSREAEDSDQQASVSKPDDDHDDRIPDRHWIDLHNVVLNWAANQTEDALRLDLTAQPGIDVDEDWVREVLEHGRLSCRISEGLSSEFIVTTLRQNGHTVLRMIRGSEPPDEQQDDVAAMEDSKLASEPEDTDDPDAHVSGRWLVRDGSRVGMELRFAHSEMIDESSSESHDQDVGSRQRTILITDDDDAMVELLTGMVDSLGDDTLTASDRDRAQAQLRDHDVDLVIINASMGAGTGWNVARWFKEANPQLPVVLVVSSETMSVPDDIPCDRILCLPFQLDELRDCLNALTAVKA